jgi:dTDP-4-dehydrorhamnose reductase
MFNVLEPMILLLGASGYIGEAFAKELRRRKADFLPLARSQMDYARFDVLLDFLKFKKPEFVVNAAGYTGKPNVDACELHKADTLTGNTLLPQTIAHACAAVKIPWGHVSSGCIFGGAKIIEPRSGASAERRKSGRGNGAGQPTAATRIEKDLTKPELHALVEKSPQSIHGFSETDTPNFSFRDGPCSFYSGSKALGEEAMADIGQSYVWRLRIPFDEFDNARNYLSKVQRYAKVYENVNSISHRGDFAGACLDLWERRAPFGIYNMTNPGFVTTRQVVGLIEKILWPPRAFEFWAGDEEFYKVAAKTPRSNCVLDPAKLLATGVTMRPVQEALEDSLKNWKSE